MVSHSQQHSHTTLQPSHDFNPNNAPTRLTLPLRDTPLLGPFKLEHDAQFTTKIFHLKGQLFETLSKSMSLANPQTATVVQELQFRVYLSSEFGGLSANGNAPTGTRPGDSLLASNKHNQQQQQHQQQTCTWPQFMQLSVNQNPVHLDRASQTGGACQWVDVFRYCQPGDNLLEIEVKDCYCHYEFTLEPVDRPTLRAFMSSCFKSRLLSLDSSLAKLRANFGSPGFIPIGQPAQSLAQAGIVNEYLSEYLLSSDGRQTELTRARISLRCPISTRRMRTPSRGPNCRHLQCFDLETFLKLNRNKTHWNCPICNSVIPFNMLELDQHQMQIIQSMNTSNNNTLAATPSSNSTPSDDLLVDPNGQWHSYFGPQHSQPLPSQQASVGGAHHAHPGQLSLGQSQQQQQQQAGPTVAKSNGTFHPQTATSCQQNPAASNYHPQAAPLRRPHSWQPEAPEQRSRASHSPLPVRRPPSVMGEQRSTAGRRSAAGSPLAKRANLNSSPPLLAQHSPMSAPTGSPLYQAQQQAQQTQQAQQMSQTQQTQQQLNTDEHLSPLAAMERTIIQHEQQMGPPPFDPSSLAASPAGRQSAAQQSQSQAQAQAQSQSQAQSQTQSQTQSHLHAGHFHQGSPAFVEQQLACSPAHSAAHSPSRGPPQQSQPAQAQLQTQTQPQIITQIPASPIQQSPKHQFDRSCSHPATPLVVLPGGAPDTPATPGNSGQQQQQAASVSHSLPPASQPVAANTSCSQAPQVPNGGTNATGSGAAIASQQLPGSSVDHAPLSNGSVSAGSVGSSSIMTPSGQSLGSVGMGSDSLSRCNTAPLPAANPSCSSAAAASAANTSGLSLGAAGSAQGPAGGAQTAAAGSLGLGQQDELLGGGPLLVGGGAHGSPFAGHQGASSNSKQTLFGHGRSETVYGTAGGGGSQGGACQSLGDAKSHELLMSRLSSAALDASGEHAADQLAFALEEAEWKHQMDRGKYEHLANFLNDPLMQPKGQPADAAQTGARNHHHQHHNHHHHAYHLQPSSVEEPENKMLSGGIQSSDDENDDLLPFSNNRQAQPEAHTLNELDHFSSYLDAAGSDDGAGLPPEDKILDIFER